MRAGHWNDLDFNALPPSLETINTGSPNFSHRKYVQGPHSKRYNLHVTESTPTDAPSPSPLQNLSTLTKIHLSSESQPYSISISPNDTSAWPSTLTSLHVSVAPADCPLLLSSLSALSLLHFGLCYKISHRMTRSTHLLTPELVDSFPQTLTSLALGNLGLQHASWARLPHSLTKICHIVPGEYIKSDSSWIHTPVPADFPPNLTDLCLTITGRNNPLNHFFRPNLRRLSLNIAAKSAGGVHTMMDPSPLPHHLTELKIDTGYSFDRNFCALLPRSLLRLQVSHGTIKLNGVDELPTKLEYLITSGTLYPLTKLPPALIHLEFAFPHLSTSKKKAAPTPHAVAKNLPRSLTYLYIEQAHDWNSSVIPYLPKSLDYCRIDVSEEQTLQFRTVEAQKDLIYPEAPSTPEKIVVEPVESSYGWLSFIWGWLVNFFFWTTNSISSTSRASKSSNSDEN